MTSRKSLGLLALAALFVVAFCIPVGFGLVQGGIISSLRLPFSKNPRIQIPTVATFSREGSFLKIPHAPELSPKVGKDFLLIAWFNLRRMPAFGKKMVILSKYRSDEDEVQGYALAIDREQSGEIRPSIYWGGSKKGKRWYAFPEFKIIPNAWVMFALSFHKDRLLGLHLAHVLNGKVVGLTKLGGYDVGEVFPQMGDADIMVGAVPGRGVRGAMGPLGIFVKSDIGDDLKSILSRYLKSPGEFPSFFNEKGLLGGKNKSVRLWLHDKSQDESMYGNKIEWVSP